MSQRHRSPRSPGRRHGGGRRAQQRPFLDLRRDEGFRVGEEVEYHSSSYQEWIEGKVLLFEDHMEHEVWAAPPTSPDPRPLDAAATWTDASLARVVLVLDVAHPDSLVRDLGR